jgi:DNA-binding transcriptional LysR family regulator
VAGLEQSLGVWLLERRTTRVTATEDVQRFHEHAKRMLEDFDDAVADARGQTQTPAGLLRINVPLALGELRLNALVLEFLALYPEIEIELIFDDRFVDRREEGVDLALRLGGPLPPSHGPEREAFVLCPTRRCQPLRARVFVQFLAEHVPRLPGFSAPIRSCA